VFNVMSSDDLRGRPGAGPELRASDAERDLVAAELGEHYQAGRLDQAEFDERVSAALRARTRRDLSGLLADLPRRQPGSGTTAPGATAPRATAPGAAVAGRPGWRAPWLPLVPLLFAAIVAAGFAAGGGWHGAHHGGGGPWPLLWLWWLIPVALVLSRRRGARRQGR
jgi:hypothetical protein